VDVKRLSIIKRDNSPPGWLKSNLVLALVAVTASLAGGLAANQPVQAYGTGGPITGIAGKCLENKDGTVATGNKIQLGTCDGSVKQTWRWEGDMSVKVQGYCLDVQTSGTTPGTAVQLWTCNNTGAQRWWQLPDGTFKNQNSNLCLDTAGGLSADGTGVQINTCNSSASTQGWAISSAAIVMVPLFSGNPHNSLPPGQRNTPTPTITVDYSQMPQWKDYLEQVAKPLLEAWYPVIVDQYSYPDHGAISSFNILAEPGYNGTATANGSQRRINFNPGLYGSPSAQPGFEKTLVHESTHMMQYNSTTNNLNLPSWIVEGWAEDSTINIFGTPAVPISSDSLYSGGYNAAQLVLDRAQQQSGGTFMKALSNNGWNNTFNYNLFKQVSGSSPAEHWQAITNDKKVSELGAFTNALSGKCLDILNFITNDGSRPQITGCNNSSAQNWAHRVTQNSTSGVIVGYFGVCLTVKDNATIAETPVEIRGCNSATRPGQKWEVVGGTIRNPNSGKCLQPVDGLQTNGTLLEIEVCNGSLIQQWTLPAFASSPVTPVTSKVLYPATFSDGQQGIGTTDGKGGGYNRILTAPINNTYTKPRGSSEGARVAFLQTTNGQQTSTLRISNVDGTSSNQMSTTGYFIPSSAPQPFWSSANDKVLVAVTPNGQTAVDKQWRWMWVNFDGSGQQLVGSSVIGGTPFAATSTKIYFVNDGSGEQQLCSVNIDGTSEACFGSAAVPKVMALSGDGARIASLATGTTTNIQVTSVGGSTSSVSLSGLGSGLTDIEEVTWVPNTTKIAFKATVSGKSAWYAIDAVSPGQINKLNIDASGITWYASAAPASTLSGAYTALTPFRVADTRSGSGQLNAGKTLSPGGSLDIQVAGLGGVPAEGASAVVLNITEAATNSNGFVTAWPTGTTRPISSTLNNTANKILNNQTTVGLGTDGKVSLFNQLGTTDLVVDVVGYYSETGGSFTPTAPKRVIDTRDNGGAPVAAWATKNVQVTGVQSIPSNATGIVADVTEVGAAGTGFLTLYPAGASLPTASSMNFYPNETLTKEVNVRLSAGGAVAVTNSSAGTTHFIIDVVGYYTNDMGGMGYTPVNPSRIADTRAGSGQPYAGQALTAGMTKLFTIGNTLMPPNATSVINNMTVASGTAGNFLLAFPASSSTPPPGTSITHVSPVSFNQSTVQLSSGPTGGFKVYNNAGTTELVLDSLGYYY
jgi:hypothetical protein